MQILDPIQQASIAVEQDLTNKEKQNTAKKQAELNTELSLIDQRREQVAQETEKIKAEVKADQEKQVAEIQADTMKQAAEIEQADRAGARPRRIRKLGEAEAEVVELVEGEKAKGFAAQGQGVRRSRRPTTCGHSRSSLNETSRSTSSTPAPGTLWTDLEKARLGDLGGAAVIQQEK